MKFIQFSIFGIILNLNSILYSTAETVIKNDGPISTNGLCGPNNGNTICPGNECCNKDGKCGFDINNFCGKNCQTGYGYCLPSNYESMTCNQCIECEDCEKNPSIALRCPFSCNKKIQTTKVDNKISTDGKCGSQNNNTICPKNECCNEDGICGFNSDYCGDGCQSDFGYCLPKNEAISCPVCKGCIDCEKDLYSALECPESCKELPKTTNPTKMENANSSAKHVINLNNLFLYVLFIGVLLNTF